MATKTHNRLILIGLALLFFTPVLLAWWLYFYGATWQPAGRVNQGELLQPPVVLANVGLHDLAQKSLQLHDLWGKWSLITVTQTNCEAVCQQNLYKIRQARLALNKNMSRVQRILLVVNPQQFTDAEQLQSEYAGTLFLMGETVQMQSLLQQLGKIDENYIYLVDPLGNLVLRYPTASEAKALLKDLKHLLKLSNIG